MNEPNRTTATEKTPEKKGPGRVARLIPWILGALIGAGLIWLFTNIVDTPNDDAALVVDTLQAPNLTGQPTAAEENPPAAVDRMADFIRFADQDRAARVGPEHVYVGDGLDRLAASIDALSEQFMADSTEMEPRLNRLRAAAERVRKNQGSGAEVRSAFQLTAEMLSTIQQQSFPQAAAQVEGVRQAAGTVIPDRPVAEQIAIIEHYFRQVGTTLQTMMLPKSDATGEERPGASS